VTAIQLGGSFVNANLHFHTLVPEGVWHEQPDGSVNFHPLPPPTDEDVEGLAVRIVHHVARLLARRDADAAVDDALDALDHAQAEAVQLPMTLSEPRPQTRTSSRRRCTLVDGFSLHANTSVDAADRAALERLSRYILRPMISADRLTVRPDGRVEYHFRRPDPTGRTARRSPTSPASFGDDLADVQVPPRGSEDLLAWIDAGHYRSWSCEPEAHADRRRTVSGRRGGGEGDLRRRRKHHALRGLSQGRGRDER